MVVIGLGKNLLFKSILAHCDTILEIKPCGLVSRIRDMEAERRLRVITDKTPDESLVSRTGAEG